MKNSLKILVLATTFPRRQGDTEPAFVFDLCRHLVVRGHEPVVLAPDAPHSQREEILYGPAEDQNDGVRIVRFPYWPIKSRQRLCYDGGALPNLRSSWQARFNLPPFLIQQRRWIGKMLNRENFDLVHAHWLLPQGFFSVRATRHSNMPVVLSAHAGDVFPIQKPGLKSLLTYTAHQGAAVTANSRATAEKLREACPDLPIEIIPMGVDIRHFQPKPEKIKEIRSRLAPESGPLLLHVGRLAPKKGQKYLLEAFPEILKTRPKAKLVIIGTGPVKPELESVIKKLNIGKQVKLVGEIPHPQMPDYFAAADIFVLPSIISPSGDTEGLGVVLLEAMAAGTPVVASAVGGILDVVTHEENGLLVDQKKPQELAAAIIRLLQETSLRNRIIEGGHRNVEKKFAWEAVAERFEQVYRKVLV